MRRMKTIFMYIGLIAAFYIFSNVLIYFSIQLSYKNIPEGEIVKGSPEIVVTDAKATNMNGFIKMKVTNQTDTTINNRYIKVDLLSQNDNIIGTKSLVVDNLTPGETREMEIKFKLERVKSFKIETTDEIIKEEETETERKDKEMYDMAFLVSGILLFPLVVTTILPPW